MQREQVQAIVDRLQCDAPISDQMKQQKLHYFRHSFQWFLDNLPIDLQERWSVLEAGHGMLGWANLYKHFFARTYGIDIEDYSKYHPGVESITCDLTQHIPLPDQSVDLIVSHSVLEHVFGLPKALANLDRILKVGGYVYITIDPLYYSACGSHVNNPVRLAQWEHLDPASKYYLLDNPLLEANTQGHVLNKMTLSDFVGWVGRLPWSIIRLKTNIDPQPIPPYVDQDRWGDMNLRTRGFFMIAKKEWHCERLRVE